MERRIIALFAAALSWACGHDPAATPRTAAQVTFSIGLQADDATRSDAPERIVRMWYAIADSDGRLFEPSHARLEEDLSGLTVEGLSAGDYTAIFLATSDPRHEATVALPERLDEGWLLNPDPRSPLDGRFFHGRIDLHIGPEQSSATRRVVLERCVGRVDVDLELASPYMRRFIRRMTLSFDDPAGLHAALNADGSYAGSGGAASFDITAAQSFHSLPDRTAGEGLSGSVAIESERSDGTSFVREYRFEGCRIEAGRIARIRIAYQHPENDEGLLRVRNEDYALYGADTMFLSDEPQEVFYDRTRRWFRVDEPLQATVTDDHRLRIRFYSPVAVDDVTILCRFDRISPEFFVLARFDTVYPFMEASFELPVVSADRIFSSADGRKVVVPAQPGLTADDVTLAVRTDDPFMEKIARIDSRWSIGFSPYSADAGHAYWRHMTPLLCRHGVALALNMSFMFASETFNTAMNDYEGLLKDNSGNPIDLDALRQRIRSHAGLVLGRVSGVGGLGGGTTYGLADYCYTGVYFDATPPGSHPHNYARQAMFHEYGHCLGYNHSSTMTYGDQWTVLCATVFVEMGSSGLLPVCSKEEVAGLPM